MPDMAPGSLKGLQLVVSDLRAARAQLVEGGVEVSEIQILGESPRPQPDPLDNVGFVFFSDPDGNGWGVQQILCALRPRHPPAEIWWGVDRPSPHSTASSISASATWA